MTLSVFRESQETPENNTLIRPRRDKLLGLLASKAYKFSKKKSFLLSSGKKSNHYLDCRIALGHVDALKCASTCLGFAISNQIDAIGGVATGGISLAAILSANSSFTAFPKPWFYVRPTVKNHGSRTLIEGYTPENGKVVLIEDVITTASSVLSAVEICQKQGLQVIEIACLVVRSDEGIVAIEQKLGDKFPIKTLFLMDEIHQKYMNNTQI